MSTTPRVNCLVTLTDELGRQFRSRIEDMGDETLVLARPLDLPVEHAFGVGAPVSLSWPDRAGVVTVDTELVESQLPGRLGCWLVRVLGPYRVQQRRQFVRVPVAGVAQLRFLDADSGRPQDPVTARLIRLSEAAVRCVVSLDDATGISLEDLLVVSFTMGSSRFALDASVLKLEPATRDKAVVELVLAFRIEENQAAALRRLVFAEQLRLRDEATATASLGR
ncbi:MAG TPA: PilZ domain-containing protein [Jatrophihabitans sp.]|nr:PilZ domain-containing protein [Jatrophihabitans sp.]